MDEVDNSSEQSVFTPTFINVMTHLHRLLQDTLQSDVSKLAHILQLHKGQDGSTFWCYDLALVVRFGAPELRAQLLWYENVELLIQDFTVMLGLRGKGIERRGPARIIYEDEREELSAQDPEVPDEEGEEVGEHDIPVRDNFDQAAE